MYLCTHSEYWENICPWVLIIPTAKMQRMYACVDSLNTTVQVDDNEEEGGLGDQAKDIVFWLRSAETGSRDRYLLRASTFLCPCMMHQVWHDRYDTHGSWYGIRHVCLIGYILTRTIHLLLCMLLCVLGHCSIRVKASTTASSSRCHTMDDLLKCVFCARICILCMYYAWVGIHAALFPVIHTAFANTHSGLVWRSFCIRGKQHVRMMYT